MIQDEARAADHSHLRTRPVRVGVMLLFVVTLAACASPPPTAVGGLPLTFQKDIALPGNASRLDYQVLDPQTNLLYIAHLGDSTIDVVDLNNLTSQVLLEPVASVHGIALASDQHTLLATASGSNELVFIDTRTGFIVGRTPTGNTPDGVAYDPINGNAYVSNEHDHIETVVNVATHSVVATIDIGSEAGNTIYNPTDQTIIVNAQSTNQLLVIDPGTNQIIHRIALTGCSSNHGLYVDGANQLAFIACEGNATLLLVDLRRQRQIDQHSVGGNPDVLAFDEGLSRLYVASESGTVSVFTVTDRKVSSLGEARLADGAHTVAIDQATHEIYFPLENVNGKPALRVYSYKK